MRIIFILSGKPADIFRKLSHEIWKLVCHRAQIRMYVRAARRESVLYVTRDSHIRVQTMAFYIHYDKICFWRFFRHTI